MANESSGRNISEKFKEPMLVVKFTLGGVEPSYKEFTKYGNLNGELNVLSYFTYNDEEYTHAVSSTLTGDYWVDNGDFI